MPFVLSITCIFPIVPSTSPRVTSRRVLCRHMLAIYANDQLNGRQVDILRLISFAWLQLEPARALELRRHLAVAPAWVPIASAAQSTTTSRADKLHGIMAQARFAAERCAHSDELTRFLCAGFKAAVDKSMEVDGPGETVVPNPETRRAARAGDKRAASAGSDEIFNPRAPKKAGQKKQRRKPNRGSGRGQGTTRGRGREGGRGK